MNQLPIEAEWEGPPQCEHCGIRDLVLFSTLKKEDFTLIQEQIDELRFEKGEMLYRAGESADHVFTVREGLLKLTYPSKNWGERIVRLLNRGDVMGLEALAGKTYQHTALVVDTTLVCRIPVSVINDLSQQLPAFYQRLLSCWQDSVDEVSAWLIELRTGPLRARVARLLIHQAEAESATVIFIPSLEDMSSILNAATASVSRVRAEFIRAGLVEKVAVKRFKVDIDGLHSLAS